VIPKTGKKAPREHPRYPFGPIEELFPDCHEFTAGRSTISEALGITSAMVANYRERGMNTATADRLAILLGLHPCLLWPSWFDDAEDESRCPWCFEWTWGASRGDVYCTRHHRKMSRAERDRDDYRIQNWWDRLARYRATVDIPVENTEVAA
jgi:hypothetical protein